MNTKITTLGFFAAGIANIAGVLLFSKLFNNPTLNQADPAAMSNFGLLVIIVWGLAYIATAKHYQTLPYLVLVFAIEKFIYIVNWFMWMKDNLNSLTDLFEQDFLAGSFYCIYGINDIFFFIFFLFVFITMPKSNNK